MMSGYPYIFSTSLLSSLSFLTLKSVGSFLTSASYKEPNAEFQLNPRGLLNISYTKTNETNILRVDILVKAMEKELEPRVGR